MQAPGRQQTEQRVGPARHGKRDRQDIVDEQGRAGDDARPGREQLAGDQVAAAAGRKQFDDLRIAGADHEHRHHRGRGHEQAQVNMAVERLKGLLGPITGGRQSVGSQSDPGEKGDERQFVKDALIRKVTRLPDQDRFQPAADAKIVHTATSARIHCRAPREQLFQLGEPDARERHGAEGSPFQMPTRLADGLGLESGLSALVRRSPHPRTSLSVALGSPASALRNSSGLRRLVTSKA